MSEKLRGALFNVLGDIDGLSVLDLCAGSGAIGLEAISRGAAFVDFVDNTAEAVQSVRENISSLNVVDVTSVMHMDYKSIIARAHKQYDVIIIDPPYDMAPVFELTGVHRLMHENGTLVVSWPSSLALPEVKGLSVVKTSRHGKAQLLFCKKTAVA